MRISNCFDKSWAKPGMLSARLGSPDLDFFTPVVRSWSGESASEGVRFCWMNLDSLVGEAGLGDESGFADLVGASSLPLLIWEPAEEGLECGTVVTWCIGGYVVSSMEADVGVGDSVAGLLAGGGEEVVPVSSSSWKRSSGS